MIGMVKNFCADWRDGTLFPELIFYLHSYCLTIKDRQACLAVFDSEKLT